MSAISLSDITKTFQIRYARPRTVRESVLDFFRGQRPRWETLTALDHISLDIKRGEFFGLIGPNGSGKSTLLKIIAGIYTPDSGRVETSGRCLPLFDLGIGFQGDLTARENVVVGGMMLGLSRLAVEDCLPQIVEFSGLAEFMDAPLNHFSAGMKLRLGFALATQVPAPIMLLDEVLLVGDEEFHRKCEIELKRFRHEGRTVVFINHALPNILQWCDRAAYLERGRLVTVGPTAAVVER
ncbi:MAG: ABC transporter ATP-binding protein, partial [Patescibacteria group bacterium]